MDDQMRTNTTHRVEVVLHLLDIFIMARCPVTLKHTKMADLVPRHRRRPGVNVDLDTMEVADGTGNRLADELLRGAIQGCLHTLACGLSGDILHHNTCNWVIEPGVEDARRPSLAPWLPTEAVVGQDLRADFVPFDRKAVFDPAGWRFGRVRKPGARRGIVAATM
jgi:hypothetical protein